MNAWLQAAWLLVTLAAGAMLPLQAGLNASLGRQLGHPVLAALISFAIGTLALLVLFLALRVPPPSLGAVRGTSLWLWSGGLLGAIWVMVGILAAPKLGAATFVGVVIGSQLAASLLLDHFGVASFAERPITLWRVAGIVLIACGVLLVQFAPQSAARPGG